MIHKFLQDTVSKSGSPSSQTCPNLHRSRKLRADQSEEAKVVADGTMDVQSYLFESLEMELLWVVHEDAH